MPYLSIINEPEEKRKKSINNHLTQQHDNDIYYDAEEEPYFDASAFFPDPESPFSTGEVKSPASGENPAAAFSFSALVKRLVDKTLFSLQLRLFARMGGVEELYCELRNFAQSHKPFANHLPELNHILQRHATLVPEDYRPIIQNVTKLTDISIRLYKYVNSPTEGISAQLHNFVLQAEDLLSFELVRNHVVVGELHRLVSLARQLHKIARFMDLHQFMPECSSFDAWLQQLARQEILPDQVQEGLQKYNAFSARLRELGAEVGEINQRYPLPAEDDWASRIHWAHQVLNDPATAGQLKTYLSSDLKEIINISAPLVQLSNHWPTGNSLAEQLTWAGQQVMAPPPELLKLAALSPFNEFVTSARRKLNDTSIDPGLLNALLELATPGQYLWNKSMNIISFYFSRNNLREAISSALRGAVNTYIPGGTLLGNAWDWYQTLPEDLNWQEALERFTIDLQQVVCTNPHLLKAVLPDYVLNSADALSALMHLPVDKSWQDILRWASGCLGKKEEYDWLYHRYMELSLARGVYEALKQGDTRQQEAVLRELAESLKTYLALRPDSGLRDLLDLLPYLPLLAGIREEIIVMPGNNTWLGLSCNLLTVLAKHPHPALKGLRQKLETRLVNFLSDSVTEGIDALWQQLPDDPLRFPGAEAVPVPATNYMSPEIFWDQQQMLDESNPAEHGSKKAQTEATPEETQAHGGAEYKEFAFSFLQQDQLLDELLAIVDEYEKDPNSIQINDTDPRFQNYAIYGGLTAGWLATLFLFWRAYRQTAPGRSGEEDIEMQELRPQAIAETVSSNNAEDGLLPASPRLAPFVNKKRYLVPSLLLSAMSGATAWAIWKKWGEEKPLTLQQVFREVLVEEDHTTLSEIAPVALPQITPVALPQIAPAASKSHTRNIRSVAEKNIVDFNSMRSSFLIWNTTSNKLVNRLVNACGARLKEKGKEKQEKILILTQLIEYILGSLKSIIKPIYNNPSPEVDRDKEIVKATISMMVFMSKIAKEIKVTNPTLHFKEKIKRSDAYREIQDFFNFDRVKSLHEHIITADNYILYNTLRSGNLFNFEDLPELKKYFSAETIDYENNYPGGIFHVDIYARIHDLIKNNPFYKMIRDDVITHKKRALYFYRDKNIACDTSYQQQYGVPSSITQDAWDLMSYTGKKIINTLSFSDPDELIKKTRSEIKKNLPTKSPELNDSWKDYQRIWAKYDINPFDVIDSYVKKYNQYEGSNLYLRGCTEAISELLQDRNNIINKLINNFTMPEDTSQQCALFFLLNRHINKIHAYQAELLKILNIASKTYSDTNISMPEKRLNTKDFGLQAAMNDIKVDAVSKLTNKIDKILSYEESLEYYDVIMNDTTENTINLKKSILDYIKVREYLFHQRLSLPRGKIDDKEKESTLRVLTVDNFNKVKFSNIEKKSLSYLIGPIFYNDYSPLKEIVHSANGYATTDKEYYRLYSDYIKSHSISEARNMALDIITSCQDNIDDYQDIFYQPQSVEEYKIIHHVKSIISPRSSSSLFIELYDSGSVKIVTLGNNKKYIISTLTDIPFITRCNEDTYKSLKSKKIKDIDAFIKNIYEDDTDNHLVEFQNKISKHKNASSHNIVEHSYSIEKQAKNESIEKPIKDIVYGIMHSFYVESAKLLKNNGNKSPVDILLGLVPFYTVIKRTLADPDYYPTLNDMAWDIVDLSISLAIVGAKIFHSSFKTIKSILISAEKSLNTATKLSTKIERYIAIMKIAAPEIIKHFPSLEKIFLGAIHFTTDVFNPLTPLTFLGSKAFKMGNSAIKKIPKIGARKFSPDRFSSITQNNKVTPTIKSNSFGEGIYNDFKYIDEMSDAEIVAARYQLPAEFHSDPTLHSLAEKTTDKSYEAAKKVIDILSPHGYDSHVIGGVFYNSISDITPIKHYAVISRKNEVELVIDVTFDNFTSSMMQKKEWAITSWEEWCRKTTSSNRLQNKFILVKEYEKLSYAEKEIAINDNRSYLESRYTRDPEFNILLMPEWFERHLYDTYTKDVLLTSTFEGIMELSVYEKNITVQKNKIQELKNEKSVHINNGHAVPISLDNKISKLERSINELEHLKYLPERMSSYLNINKSDITGLEHKLEIYTPVSYKLGNLFENLMESSICNIDDIKSINDKGLAIMDGNHFIIYNEKLYPITLTPGSKDKATLKTNFYTVNIEYSRFKWEIVGNPFQFADSIIIDEFSRGSTSPLRNRGLLNPSENTPIGSPFDVIRLDKDVSMSKVKTFSPAELQGDLKGKISTATGDKLSSKTITGPAPGKWKQGDISDVVDFIHVSNGSSGCVGIKIPFEQLSADRPVIVSAGQLSGCTMIYATDNRYFYAYHSGQKPGDKNWLTSQQGVDKIYKAHLALKGITIPSLANKKLTNHDLPTIFSEYQSSLITYFGKNTSTTGDTHITQQPWSNVNTFDYNRPPSNRKQLRVGLAYAVLSKNGGKVNISAYSEDLAINYNTNKMQVLSSQHQQLKGDTPSSQEDIFEINVDIISDLYSSFVSVRKHESLYSNIRDENKKTEIKTPK